jgi:Spy/CpxP family protein refolding chaperone
MGPMRGQRQALLDKLQLTDVQKEQMQKLRLDLEKKQIPIQEKIRMTRLDMKELMLADKPDKGAIEKLMKTVSDLQFQEKVNVVEHMFAVKDILTPEQQKIAKEHLRGMQHFRGMRRWGRGMGMMEGGPEMGMDPQPDLDETLDGGGE